MNVRGVPPAAYPVCAVCCVGGGGGWYPVLVLTGGRGVGTLSCSWAGKRVPLSWGTPPLPQEWTWDQKLGYPIPPSPQKGTENRGQGRNLGPEAMEYPLPPLADELKTLPSRRPTYAGGKKVYHLKFETSFCITITKRTFHNTYLNFHRTFLRRNKSLSSPLDPCHPQLLPWTCS